MLWLISGKIRRQSISRFLIPIWWYLFDVTHLQINSSKKRWSILMKSNFFRIFICRSRIWFVYKTFILKMGTNRVLNMFLILRTTGIMFIKYTTWMVPENTVHMIMNCPLFDTRGSLIFDIDMASYKITYFSSSFLYFTLHVYKSRSRQGHRIHCLLVVTGR